MVMVSNRALLKILSELQANVFELHLPLKELTCLKRGLDPGAVRGRRGGWRCQHAEEEEEDERLNRAVSVTRVS